MSQNASWLSPDRPVPDIRTAVPGPKAQAALVPSGKQPLLALWANPQLKALGTKAEDGIKGVYGTQNNLPCAGQYY